jgi:hypothetical protein
MPVGKSRSRVSSPAETPLSEKSHTRFGAAQSLALGRNGGGSCLLFGFESNPQQEPDMTFNRKLLAAPLLGVALSLGGFAITVTGCTAITEKSPREALTDAEIVARAKTIFAADPVVKARNIHVTAIKGDVTLTGVVRSEEEALRAVELIRPISGVNTVVSALKIEG